VKDADLQNDPIRKSCKFARVEGIKTSKFFRIECQFNWRLLIHLATVC